MLLLQEYICSCGAIKTEVQPNAESVTLSAFHVYCTPPCCQAGGDVVILFTWSAGEQAQSMSQGNLEGGQSRGSHVKPALPGPLNRGGQDRML